MAARQAPSLGRQSAIMSRSAAVVTGAASVIALLSFILWRYNDHPSMSNHRAHSKTTEAQESAVDDASVKLQTPAIPTLVGSRWAPFSRGSAAEKLVDETRLLTQLRDLAASDPQLSLKLAREGVARFPDSPYAPKFEWNAVKALFNMGRLDDAKDEARIMLWKYPDSEWSTDVDRHLLHPQPNPTNE